MFFTNPLFLFLLLLMPLVIYLGWPARGYSRQREILSLVLRCVILLALILALAGLECPSSLSPNNAPLAVVFVVDGSDSMTTTAKQAAFDYVRQALKAMRPDDQAALVTFRGDALVERPMSTSKELGAITSIPITNQTNLAEAIRLALALYPPDLARRMVILSDGAVTIGDATRAAQLALSSGVEVQALPFISQLPTEVMISAVDSPEQLRLGDRFDLNVTLESSQATAVTLRILTGGQLLYESQQNLKKGRQTLNLPLTASQAGFIPYQVQVVPEFDTYYQNNQMFAYSKVSGPPKVLLVASPAGESIGFKGEIRPDEIRFLQSALVAGGFVIQAVQPINLPFDLPGLAEYAAVILVDTPARELNPRQMANLESYVKDLGGGLVAVGGPTSYGVGGYYKTSLEKALPVEMQIKDEKRRPSLTMVFIIDHSGSMSETSGGVVKVEIAKEAAMRSIELLSPGDRIGVIAFDDAASWVVPITDLVDPESINRQIGTIRPGGGTDIMAGIQAMARLLPDEATDTKHVILLTDGGADPTGIPELVQKLYQENNITLTTVGVGRDAAPFLKDLAEVGGGRYHFAADASAIPAIFTEETSLATRSYINEEPFLPLLVNTSSILSDLNATPLLYGYVGTSPKDSAQVILATPKGDPLLAIWRYGLGRSLAFTSDATGRWAKDWITWEGFATFWAQAVRAVVGDPVVSPLETHVILENGSARLIVDALGSEELEPFLNNYQMQANIISPDGTAQSMVLHQTAPGRYETHFTPSSQGTYLLRVTGEQPVSVEVVKPGSDNSSNVPETLSTIAGWTLSYSPEYRRLEADPDALLRVIAAAGGRLSSNDPAQVFTARIPFQRAGIPIWPGLLALAAVLLPLDIASRRLVVSRRDLHTAWENVTARTQAHLKNIAPTGVPPRSMRMEQLIRAKGRASGEPLSKEIPPSDKANEILSQKPLDRTPIPPPPAPSIQAKEPSKPSGTGAKKTASTTSTLLAKKRSRQK